MKGLSRGEAGAPRFGRATNTIFAHASVAKTWSNGSEAHKNHAERERKRVKPIFGDAQHLYGEHLASGSGLYVLECVIRQFIAELRPDYEAKCCTEEWSAWRDARIHAAVTPAAPGSPNGLSLSLSPPL